MDQLFKYFSLWVMFPQSTQDTWLFITFSVMSLYPRALKYCDAKFFIVGLTGGWNVGAENAGHFPHLPVIGGAVRLTGTSSTFDIKGGHLADLMIVSKPNSILKVVGMC